MRDRSCESNRVTIGEGGRPVCHYKITPADAKIMLRGVRELYRIMRAAGARAIVEVNEGTSLKTSTINNR
jgi:hypothetical protein